MSPSICCAFASSPARAERSASFTPASTRSASASGSSLSIASGEISIAVTSPAPVEGLGEQVDELLFAGRLLVGGRGLAGLTELEDELEAAAGHVVERVG